MHQVWIDGRLQRDQLVNLGLRVALGHGRGIPCPSAIPEQRRFLILDQHGFHGVAFNFCGSQTHTRVEQLREARLMAISANIAIDLEAAERMVRAPSSPGR